MRMPMLAAVPILMLAPAPLIQSSVFDGRPSFSQSVELGYYLWRDGNSWHVRWTTKGRARTFAGSISATGGSLKSFQRIDVDSERKILYPGRGRLLTIVVGAPTPSAGRPPVLKMGDDGKLNFDALTENDIDGFDFEVEDVDELRFDLAIDGSALPNRIMIGRKNKKPSELPLIIVLK